MARSLRTNHEIDAFINRVVSEAHHHGASVETVIKPLSDELRKRLDLSIDKVEVYERNGKLARTCWVTIKGSRYVFSYNYTSKKIELRERTLQGKKRFDFDNTTGLNDIRMQVAGL